MVSSVSALQPLMVLLYVVVLSIFVPGLLEEELDRHSIMRKLAAVVMVSLGIYLISEKMQSVGIVAEIFLFRSAAGRAPVT